MISKQDLKRLRETEFYKFDYNNSDFKTIRKCYSVAKQLYECLKWFDSRVSRSTLLYSSASKREHDIKRAFAYPSEYYSFRSLDVLIEIQKDVIRNEWYVLCQGYRPMTFIKENVDNLRRDDSLPVSGFYKCGSDNNLKCVIQNFYKVLFEYLSVKSVSL